MVFLPPPPVSKWIDSPPSADSCCSCLEGRRTPPLPVQGGQVSITRGGGKESEEAAGGWSRGRENIPNGPLDFNGP